MVRLVLYKNKKILLLQKKRVTIIIVRKPQQGKVSN